MSLEGEFFSKKIWRPEQRKGRFSIEPAANLPMSDFFYPSQILMFVHYLNNFARVQIENSGGLLGIKYLDEADNEGISINTNSGKPIRLYPGQALFLAKRISWKETRFLNLWMT